VTGKRIAILGFAFKADTNDTREAPAIRICQDLLEEGARLAIYDPKVPEAQIADDLGMAAQTGVAGSGLGGDGVWQAVASPEEAVAKADAVLVLTEWQSFYTLNWSQLALLMRRPAWLFDARSVTDLTAARAAGLQVWRVGMG
jgi:UDPglucose 6-dehydrogenase